MGPFPFQDMWCNCDRVGSDGGCSALTVTLKPYEPWYEYTCPDYYSKEITIHGEVSDGSVVGVALPVSCPPLSTQPGSCGSAPWTSSGSSSGSSSSGSSSGSGSTGGASAQFGYAQVDAYGGSSGTTWAQSGTVTITDYAPGGSSGSPRAAGTFDTSIQGQFDTAYPQCACSCN